MKWTSIKHEDSHSRAAAEWSGQVSNNMIAIAGKLQVSNNKIAIAGQQLNEVDEYQTTR